jgi:hypothetical protein
MHMHTRYILAPSSVLQNMPHTPYTIHHAYTILAQCVLAQCLYYSLNVLRYTYTTYFLHYLLSKYYHIEMQREGETQSPQGDNVW